MNTCIFMGRLTKDPDYRELNEKRLAMFSLAVDKPVKMQNGNDADFFQVNAWGQLADFTNTWLKKGMKILVTARAENHNYTDKNGMKRYEIRFIAEKIEFAESKKAEDKKEDGWMDIPDDVDDSELPFA